MRRFLRSSTFIGWFSFVLISSTNPAFSVPNIVFSTLKNGCTTLYSNASLHGDLMFARSATTITGLNVYIGNGSQTNFLSSKYFIMSNNGSTNLPLSILETFTPDVITGTGSTTNAHYRINYTLSAGTKFWIVEGQQSTAFPRCFAQSFDATTIPSTSLAIDTSTTSSNTSFRRAYIYDTAVSTNSSWSLVTDDLIFQYSIEAGTISTVNVSVALNSGSSNTVFRTSTAIKATVDLSSKVTFYANGKLIPGCRNVLSSAGSAICNWRPSVHGSSLIKARAIPTDGSSLEATSSAITIGIAPRTNTR